MPITNRVQLITYPDSLGQNLAELHYVLKCYFSGAIGGIHLLPFFPSSADRGFAHTTYDRVDPAFGTWRDIEKIGRDFELMIDFMVNHISRQSIFFQDYLQNGKQSPYADMFLSFDKLAPGDEIREEDLAKIYTRKPRPPYDVIERSDGTKEKIWSTFDYEQIDLDWQSPVTKKIMRNFLFRLAHADAAHAVPPFQQALARVAQNLSPQTVYDPRHPRRYRHRRRAGIDVAGGNRCRDQKVGGSETDTPHEIQEYLSGL